MADWNDQQRTKSPFGGATINGDVIGAASRDEGLRRYMLGIYNYMASGVLLSGLVAMLFASSSIGVQVMSSPLRWLIMLAPLGFVFAMNFNRSESTLKTMFWAFCVIMGMSMSTIFMVYSGTSIATTFFATAGAFAGLSLYGYSTKRNLSAMGAFLTMGVIGLIIAMVVNMFMQSGPLALVISGLGVLIFAGLTAYDTQRLRETYYQVQGTDMLGKVVILGALTLYLDFINMFQFLLSFLGSRD
ncbi:MAG: Bax inhibitor-1/YccA family protein [Novosphingobium sp.]|uniref:Bax inhibitor-1/YccA family protein n=1 Tax=Novosphingobium sp. TaxID=1874826 RepID=UPI0032B98038